jgi:Methyltransferase domain
MTGIQPAREPDLPPSSVPNCGICGGSAVLLDVVDFNKSCEERSGVFLPRVGTPIEYAICSDCDFCWAPQMWAWSKEEFQARVYNDDYAQVDPEYLEIRPRYMAQIIRRTFPSLPSTVRHLDYGGGHGQMARLLRESGWNSRSFDPFVNTDTAATDLGKFDLITAFEVFEHVPDVSGLMASLQSLLNPNGVIVFSTFLSDGHLHRNQKLSWWYASPRNGHISLFSRKSLVKAAHSYGFKYGILSNDLHMFLTTLPSWAAHLASPLRIISRAHRAFSRLFGPSLKLMP